MKLSSIALASLLAIDVNGFSLQESFQQVAPSKSFLDRAIDALGLDKKSVLDSMNLGSLNLDLKEIWNEMPLKFPKQLEEIQFITKPKFSTKKNEPKFNARKWDYVTKDSELSNYQLRVNKIKDTKKLGVDPDVKQFTGYLDVEDEDKHFFYWFFESRNDPKNDPVILWLNGGPGCSSMTGLFFELGPSSIGSQIKPIYNDFSWNSNASVIFLDQPVNVGFSYSGSEGVSNTVAAGKDVYAFLQLFFKQFPNYSKLDFHIAGESYAGHYIPVFASEILSHPQEERNFNLTSIMIGNGLTDPLTQYNYYEPMACGEGGADPVLSPEECKQMDDTLDRCLKLIEACYNSESVWTCVPASIYCNNAQLGPYQRTGKNVYDVRKDCEGQLCYADLEFVDKYLNEDYVKETIGAEVDHFESCNFDINRNFLFNGDWMKPYQKAVTDLLNQDLPILIYAGDKDFICNWLGNRAWTDVLPWKNDKDYENQHVRKWIASETNEHAGDVKSFGKLTYLRIFDGGHMVPYDQPENSLSMINEWVHGNFSL